MTIRLPISYSRDCFLGSTLDFDSDHDIDTAQRIKTTCSLVQATHKLVVFGYPSKKSSQGTSRIYTGIVGIHLMSPSHFSAAETCVSCFSSWDGACNELLTLGLPMEASEVHHPEQIHYLFKQGKSKLLWDGMVHMRSSSYFFHWRDNCGEYISEEPTPYNKRDPFK